MTDANLAPPAPHSIPCQLLNLLGSGATGHVWRACLTGSFGELPAGTEFALKRMHPATAKDKRQRAAFERESQVAIALCCPGLVKGIAGGEDEHGPWLALRLLPGLTLREQLHAHGALPEPQVRAVGSRLVRALLALRAAGFHHGDIKPENVRLDQEGLAVLLDLGFLIPTSDGSEKPKTAPIIGSLAYLAPEEFRGLRAGEPGEVYSLGVLLYELGTSSHPFASAEQLLHPGALPSILASAEFELPSFRTPTLTPLLDRLLEAMLDSDPRMRPSLDELESILRESETGSWWRDQLHNSGPHSIRRGAGSASSIPLVGRDKELDKLLQASKHLLEDERLQNTPAGAALRLEGPRGSGKSRLIREFARCLRNTTNPPIYLQGRCSRFEEARPCHPILTLLRRYLGLPTGMAPGARERERIAQILPRTEAVALEQALDPSFEGALTASVPSALTSWLVALAERTPVVVYLDDLDFADEGTLDILSRLTRHLQSVPLLLILGYTGYVSARRPKAQGFLLESLKRFPNYKKIALKPLTKTAIRQLVAAIFSKATPRLRLANVLWERSRGNPGLISELLRRLYDNGDMTRGVDGLELRIHPDQLPLPSSLREEITEAFSRLKPGMRLWLSRLAVTGGRIQSRFLLSAWPRESASELNEVLAHLTQVGWLRPEGDRYRFRRPALRAAVYKRLAEGRRREMHSAVARALRPGPGGRLSLADAFQRVYHLRAAGSYQELLQLLRPLLQRLAERGQPARMHTLALWGLEAMAVLPKQPDHGEQAMLFLWAAADAADRLGYREKQRLLLDQLADFDTDPDTQPEQAGRTYLLHARYAISTGQFGNARGMLVNAIRCFEASGSVDLLSDSLRRQSSVHTHVGEFSQARKLARRSQDLAPDNFLRARAEHTLGVLDMLEGQFESSLRRCDKCLMLLRDSDRFEALAVRALAHSLRARVYRGAGRPRRGLVSAQHALRFAKHAGDRRLEIEAQARLGVHLLDIDRAEEAETLLRDAILMAQEIEDRRSESIATLFLGILLAEQDDRSAGPYFERCHRLSKEIGNARTLAVCISMQARMAYQTSAEAALKHSTKAMELLAHAGAELIDRIVICGTHAMVLEALGHNSKAKTLLESLRKRMRAASNRIESRLMQRRQRLATNQLLRAALTSKGPVYRRVHIDSSEQILGPGHLAPGPRLPSSEA